MFRMASTFGPFASPCCDSRCPRYSTYDCAKWHFFYLTKETFFFLSLEQIPQVALVIICIISTYQDMIQVSRYTWKTFGELIHDLLKVSGGRFDTKWQSLLQENFFVSANC